MNASINFLNVGNITLLMNAIHVTLFTYLSSIEPLTMIILIYYMVCERDKYMNM